ncbi:MAG: beta-L-arabinofuranosidase domain-containing protein, partial [Janthinobacterium lividum]
MPWTDRYRTDRRNAKAPVLRPLGLLGDVMLTEGPFAARLDDAAETYLAIPADDILYGFRLNAGLRAPGRPMTGWAERTSESTFGQWVSGLARLSAVLDDPRLAQRAAELAYGWAATLPRDAETGMDYYRWEKVVCGLVDLSLYTGDDGALGLLTRLTRHAATAFDRTRHAATAAAFTGQVPARTLEWYTLAENLHRGYLAGGDGDLEDFATVWHYEQFWSRFQTRPAPGQPWPVPAWLHAYSHLNTFASAAAAYEVTGETRLLQVCENAYDYFTQTQCYATGGFGPGELLVPEDGALGRALEWRSDTAEIVCGSWAAFKVVSALTQATGEARYSDWAERLLYSGLGAVTPVTTDGKSPYYQDYRLGTCAKVAHWSTWPCCSGSYVQAVAHIPDLIYYATDDGVAVALYIPSRVRLKHLPVPVVLTQSTHFPESDSTRLHLSLDRPLQFTLRLRVPGWTHGMRVYVNQQLVLVSPSDTGWLELDRTWQPDDEIDVDLGARLDALPVDRWHPNRVAFRYGPVVLAQDAVWTAPLYALMPRESVDLDRLLFRTGERLEFASTQAGTNRQPVGGFRPLADVPDGRPHRIYL